MHGSAMRDESASEFRLERAKVAIVGSPFVHRLLMLSQVGHHVAGVSAFVALVNPIRVLPLEVLA